MIGRREVFLWRNFQQDQKNEYDNLQEQHLQTSGTLCVRKLCRVHCRCHYYFYYYRHYYYFHYYVIRHGINIVTSNSSKPCRKKKIRQGFLILFKEGIHK